MDVNSVHVIHWEQLMVEGVVMKKLENVSVSLMLPESETVTSACQNIMVCQSLIPMVARPVIVILVAPMITSVM